ncbi:lysophospholipid acyltransferase family protein [Blastomonas sp.]|uniref:lysophospholipid acyltransferase family protein n=1 Tax=Blastomonas sp. TaxID=1909299 RepID=UPI0035939D2E
MSEVDRAVSAPAAPPPYPDTPDMAHLHWRDPGLIGRVRLAFRVATIALVLVAFLPFYYLWRGLRLSNPWPKLFLRAVGRACGARVRIIGTPLKRDVFYISNHLSWLDIPVIAGRNGSSFVAQDGIKTWPVVGWLCRLNNTVFVSRGNRMGIAGQINELREALVETWAITVFPEGTTSDGSGLLPFKSPLLQVLDPPPPGVMVQPLYLDYGTSAHDIAWVGEETAPNNALRLFTRRGSFAVTLHFLEPFSPADFPGRKAIAAEARARIAAALSASLGGVPIV